MKHFQVMFAIYVEVTAEDKYEASERARDQLVHAGLGFSDVMDLDDDPVVVVELDEHGDPITDGG